MLTYADKQADGNNWLGLNVPAGRLYNDELKQVCASALIAEP
jgi:sulfite reductase beta subunit-like hemoprotein